MRGGCDLRKVSGSVTFRERESGFRESRKIGSV